MFYVDWQVLPSTTLVPACKKIDLGWGCGSGVECVFNMCEAQGSIPSTTKNSLGFWVWRSLIHWKVLCLMPFLLKLPQNSNTIEMSRNRQAISRLRHILFPLLGACSLPSTSHSSSALPGNAFLIKGIFLCLLRLSGPVRWFWNMLCVIYVPAGPTSGISSPILSLPQAHLFLKAWVFVSSLEPTLMLHYWSRKTFRKKWCLNQVLKELVLIPSLQSPEEGGWHTWAC